MLIMLIMLIDKLHNMSKPVASPLEIRKLKVAQNKCYVNKKSTKSY